MISPYLGGISIVVALYTILFSGMPSFDVEDAERMISELSTHLAEESSHRGKETKLQYSSVDIKGLAYEKYAHISKLSLDFIYQQWQGGTRFGVSTENADLIPDPIGQGRIIVRFNDTLNLISSSELLAMIQPAKPIIYSFNKKPTESAEAVKHRLQIPGNIGITMLNPKREITLQLSQPVKADTIFFQNQHRLRTQITSGPILALLERGHWRIDAADIRYDSVQKSADVIESKGTLTFDNIAFNRQEVTPNPYTLTAAWTQKDQRNISGATDASQLTIEHGLLTDGNVKISAEGALNFDIDDAPYGEVTVEINNPLQFLKSEWIAPDKEALGLSLLTEIMGGEIDATKQVIIPIARPKNGQWHVGKMTLSDLLDKGFLSLFTFLRMETTHDKNNNEETTGAS